MNMTPIVVGFICLFIGLCLGWWAGWEHLDRESYRHCKVWCDHPEYEPWIEAYSMPEEDLEQINKAILAESTPGLPTKSPTAMYSLVLS